MPVLAKLAKEHKYQHVVFFTFLKNFFTFFTNVIIKVLDWNSILFANYNFKIFENPIKYAFKKYNKKEYFVQYANILTV